MGTCSGKAGRLTIARGRAVATWLTCLICIATVLPVGAQEDMPTQPAAGTETGAAWLDGSLPGLDDVRISRHGALLILSGTVASAADREMAEKLAEANSGGAPVLNRIAVGLPAGVDLGQVLRQGTARAKHWLARLPMMAVALLAGWLMWRIGRWISGRAWVVRSARNRFAAEILKQAIRIAGAVAGVLVALELLGATALAAAVIGSAGVAGIALGFAFRDLLENYIAGILLSLRQPFAPDDIVMIEGREGVVVGMNSRATILMTHDGNHLTLPNSIVFKAVILNLTRNGNRRFEFVVDLAADTDLAAALRVGLAAVRSATGVLSEPAPFVQIKDVGRELAQLQFFGWVDQRSGNFGFARSEAMRLARAELAGIGAYFGPRQLRVVTSTADASAAPVRHRVQAVHPAQVPNPDERGAVDEAIARTRSEMGGSDMLRNGSRE